VNSSWWLARIGDLVIWARLDTGDSGTASVFDSDGTRLAYDSQDSARAALLDAEFRALDGLDADDAAELGLDLAALGPPHGESDEELLPLMVRKLPPRH
jgi:hypothetical protein